MGIINNLILNEVKYQLDRKPTPEEILDVARWLGERTNDKSMFSDYEYQILMWAKHIKGE